MSSSATFVMERGTPSHIVVLLQSCTCSTDVVKDHVSDLSSFEESIVLLRLLLFHVDSPPETRGQNTTSERGVVRPDVELDDFNSSMFLAETTSLIHTKASVVKLELEQTSHLKFVFQNTKVVEFGNVSKSILSASFFLGAPLCC